MQAAAGDQSAFAGLYHRYGARLHVYFRKRCKGDGVLAEDLRQKVFMRLLESQAFRDAENGPEDLSSLLFTIAANLLKNEYRSREREVRRLAAYRDIRRVDSTDELRVGKAVLWRAIATLPEHQRICLELRYRQGYSIEEIALATEVAQGTVKSRLHYGLKKMADRLRKITVE